MKARTKLLFILLFLIINATVYYITETSLENKTDIVLKNNIKLLRTHYKILLETQKSTAICTK